TAKVADWTIATAMASPDWLSGGNNSAPVVVLASTSNIGSVAGARSGGVYAVSSLFRALDPGAAMVTVWTTTTGIASTNWTAGGDLVADISISPAAADC